MITAYASFYFKGRVDDAESHLKYDVYINDDTSTGDQLAHRFYAESALMILGIKKPNGRQFYQESFREMMKNGGDLVELAKTFLESYREYLEFGKGSFNFAYLNYPDNIVLRVGECEYSTQVQRGLQLVDLISKEYNCGPSLLRQFGQSSQPGKVPKEVEVYFGDDDPIYCWQKLEFLENSFDKCDIDVAYQCLVWFFAELQSSLGFKHKDLKLANIMIRRYPQEQSYIFTFGDEHFKVSTQYVPVVLDLDFATLPDTNMEWQMEAGTPYTRPPEKILLDVTHYTYDYWSLGITLLEMRIPYILLFPKATNLGVDYGSVFLNSVRIKRALGDLTEIPKNYIDAIPPAYRGLLNSIEYANLADEINKHFNHNQKYYINHLLSWNPADRDFFGNPYMLFGKFFTAKEKNWLEMFLGWFPGVNQYSMDKDAKPYWKKDIEEQGKIREKGIAIIKNDLIG